MNKKLVSIIVPVYNTENYIARCISSILNQSYTNIEIIIINDGSTDKSLDIIKSFLDNRITVINKNNEGLSTARNYGLNICKGDYVCFVDSDDYISTNYVEKLLVSIGDSDLCICCFTSVNNGHFYKSKELEDGEITHYDFWKLMYSGYGEICVCAWNKLYKRTIFSELRYMPGILYEDGEIIHKIIQRSQKIKTIKDYLYFYSKENCNSITSKEKSIKGLFDSLFSTIERIQYFLSNANFYNFASVNIEEILIALYRIKKSGYINDSNILYKQNYLKLKREVKKILTYKNSDRKIKRFLYWMYLYYIKTR